MKQNLAHNVVMLHDYSYKQGVIEDRAGYNNKGALTGATFIGSPWGLCLDFNGNTHREDIPYRAALGVGDKFGIRVWLKTSTTGSQERYIFCGGEMYYCLMLLSTGKVQYKVANAAGGYGASWESLDSVKTIDDDKWHLIDAYVNGTAMEIYIDGKRDNTKTLAAAKIYDSTQQLSIGNRWNINFSGTPADGTMDTGDFKARWGIQTSKAAFKLIRASETFITKGVIVGDKVTNRSANTYATVTNVDSETQLSISADIFQVNYHQYTVGLSYDDIRFTGTYTGDSTAIYKVEIDGTGTPDTFKWSDDNGASYTTGISITGSVQSLSNGISVTFDNTTGHAVGCGWAGTMTTYNFIGQIVLVGISHAGNRLYENAKEWRDNFRYND